MNEECQHQPLLGVCRILSLAFEILCGAWGLKDSVTAVAHHGSCLLEITIGQHQGQVGDRGRLLDISICVFAA